MRFSRRRLGRPVGMALKSNLPGLSIAHAALWRDTRGRMGTHLPVASIDASGTLNPSNPQQAAITRSVAGSGRREQGAYPRQDRS